MTSATLGPGASHRLGEAQRPRCQKQDPRGRNTPRSRDRGRRNYVTGEVWKNKHPFRLAPNKAISDDVAWQCKHYTGRGVMKLHRRYGSACFEDGGFDRSPHSSFLENGPGSRWSRSQRILAASLGTSSGKKLCHDVVWGPDFTAQPYCVDCGVFGRVARGACTRYNMCGRFDPAAGSVNVVSSWRTLS